MRTVIWFAYFWSYLVVVLPLLYRCRRLKREGKVKEHDEIVSSVVQRWARRLLRLAGAEITIEGLENLPSDDTAAVYVSNHQSYFDIPMVLGYLGRSKGLVAKKELKKLPLVTAWMEEINCVFIDRENPRASVLALSKAAENVKNGYSMVVFPEGTRSKTGEPAQFKSGAFKMAQKNSVPVVPFMMDGTSFLLERNGRFIIKPAKAVMRVLPPIDTSDYSKEDWKALPQLCEDKITAALKEYRSAGEGKQ